MRQITKIIQFGMLNMLLTTVCFAHTPYLKPHSFEPLRGGLVTLDASFAEKFFVPEVAFADSVYHIIQPNGKKQKPDYLSQLKSRVVVEHSVEQEGTYRFSTGRRLGRIFKSYELDGERVFMRDPSEPFPEGAKILSHFQSLTMAETYVTQGAPNDTALQAYGTGLEFVATSHPNDLFVNDTFKLIGLFDGEPLEGLKVSVYLAKDQFTDKEPVAELVSNRQGEFEFSAKQSGTYLVMARHRTAAPASSPVPQISNTYTLVFEVVE